MSKKISWVCYPVNSTENFKNANWGTPEPDKKNRLAIITPEIQKTPYDPIPNPNFKNQTVLPSSIVKKIKVYKEDMLGDPPISKIQIIGKKAFHLVDSGAFDPEQFYYLGNIVKNKDNYYLNLIVKNSHNLPLTDKYAWVLFNFETGKPTPTPTPTPKLYGLLNTFQ